MPLVYPTTDVSGLLDDLLGRRILVLDGAMGTMVHALQLDEADFRGERFADHPKDLKNFIDILCLTQPEAIAEIHRQYLEAGADIIETNTFGATSVGDGRLRAVADRGPRDEPGRGGAVPAGPSTR